MPGGRRRRGGRGGPAAGTAGTGRPGDESVTELPLARTVGGPVDRAAVAAALAEHHAAGRSAHKYGNGREYGGECGPDHDEATAADDIRVDDVDGDRRSHVDALTP
ncbi:hypothetical protein SCMC78_31070 [Streptomyces sp. CMC78]|uniref:Uncharacterized protein n=1 Tax=Streptomyces sp. CMC78 TaxID=3231512 RepID=A0AB33KFW9_9ACTN